MSRSQSSPDRSLDPSDVLHRPAVTVDVVTLTIMDGDLRVLLQQRHEDPYAGCWAIPGRFVTSEEDLEDAARYELAASARVNDIYLEQLYTFGDPHRDPRLRVITVVYYALMHAARVVALDASPQTPPLQWFSLHRLPDLAFDHQQILFYTLQRLRGKLTYTPIGFQLLPTIFTLSELQAVHEAILGRQLDKRNFRKKLFAMGVIEETDQTKMEGPHRPARLYRAHPDAYRE